VSLLFPLAAVRRLVRRRVPVENARSDVHPAPAPANRLFDAALRVEEALDRVSVRLPFGLSVFCVARKPDARFG
jgi:hypothetical protein